MRQLNIQQFKPTDSTDVERSTTVRFILKVSNAISLEKPHCTNAQRNIFVISIIIMAVDNIRFNSPTAVDDWLKRTKVERHQQTIFNHQYVVVQAINE